MSSFGLKSAEKIVQSYKDQGFLSKKPSTTVSGTNLGKIATTRRPKKSRPAAQSANVASRSGHDAQGSETSTIAAFATQHNVNLSKDARLRTASTAVRSTSVRGSRSENNSSQSLARQRQGLSTRQLPTSQSLSIGDILGGDGLEYTTFNVDDNTPSKSSFHDTFQSSDNTDAAPFTSSKGALSRPTGQLSQPLTSRARMSTVGLIEGSGNITQPPGGDGGKEGTENVAKLVSEAFSDWATWMVGAGSSAQKSPSSGRPNPASSTDPKKKEIQDAQMLSPAEQVEMQRFAELLQDWEKDFEISKSVAGKGDSNNEDEIGQKVEAMLSARKQAEQTIEDGPLTYEKIKKARKRVQDIIAVCNRFEEGDAVHDLVQDVSASERKMFRGVKDILKHSQEQVLSVIRDHDTMATRREAMLQGLNEWLNRDWEAELALPVFEKEAQDDLNPEKFPSDIMTVTDQYKSRLMRVYENTVDNFTARMKMLTESQPDVKIMDSLRLELEKAMKKIERLTTAASEASDHISNLQVRGKALERAADRLRTLRQEDEDSLTKMQEANEDLTVQLLAAESKAQRLEDALMEKDAAHQRDTGRLEMIAQNLSEQQNQAGQFELDIAERDEQIKELSVELAKLKADLSIAEKSAADTNEAKDSARASADEVLGLRENLRFTEDTLEQTKKEVDMVRSEILHVKSSADDAVSRAFKAMKTERKNLEKFVSNVRNMAVVMPPSDSRQQLMDICMEAEKRHGNNSDMADAMKVFENLRNSETVSASVQQHLAPSPSPVPPEDKVPNSSPPPVALPEPPVMNSLNDMIERTADIFDEAAKLGILNGDLRPQILGSISRIAKGSDVQTSDAKADSDEDEDTPGEQESAGIQAANQLSSLLDDIDDGSSTHRSQGPQELDISEAVAGFVSGQTTANLTPRQAEVVATAEGVLGIDDMSDDEGDAITAPGKHLQTGKKSAGDLFAKARQKVSLLSSVLDAFKFVDPGDIQDEQDGVVPEQQPSGDNRSEDERLRDHGARDDVIDDANDNGQLSESEWEDEWETDEESEGPEDEVPSQQEKDQGNSSVLTPQKHVESTPKEGSISNIVEQPVEENHPKDLTKFHDQAGESTEGSQFPLSDTTSSFEQNDSHGQANASNIDDSNRHELDISSQPLPDVSGVPTDDAQQVRISESNAIIEPEATVNLHAIKTEELQVIESSSDSSDHIAKDVKLSQYDTAPAEADISVDDAASQSLASPPQKVTQTAGVFKSADVSEDKNQPLSSKEDVSAHELQVSSSFKEDLPEPRVEEPNKGRVLQEGVSEPRNESVSAEPSPTTPTPSESLLPSTEQSTVDTSVVAHEETEREHEENIPVEYGQHNADSSSTSGHSSAAKNSIEDKPAKSTSSPNSASAVQRGSNEDNQIATSKVSIVVTDPEANSNASTTKIPAASQDNVQDPQSEVDQKEQRNLSELKPFPESSEKTPTGVFDNSQQNGQTKQVVTVNSEVKSQHVPPKNLKTQGVDSELQSLPTSSKTATTDLIDHSQQNGKIMPTVATNSEVKSQQVSPHSKVESSPNIDPSSQPSVSHHVETNVISKGIGNATGSTDVLEHPDKNTVETSHSTNANADPPTNIQPPATNDSVKKKKIRRRVTKNHTDRVLQHEPEGPSTGTSLSGTFSKAVSSQRRKIEIIRETPEKLSRSSVVSTSAHNPAIDNVRNVILQKISTLESKLLKFQGPVTKKSNWEAALSQLKNLLKKLDEGKWQEVKAYFESLDDVKNQATKAAEVKATQQSSKKSKGGSVFKVDPGNPIIVSLEPCLKNIVLEMNTMGIPNKTAKRLLTSISDAQSKMSVLVGAIEREQKKLVKAKETILDERAVREISDSRCLQQAELAKKLKFAAQELSAKLHEAQMQIQRMKMESGQSMQADNLTLPVQQTRNLTPGSPRPSHMYNQAKFLHGQKAQAPISTPGDVFVSDSALPLASSPTGATSSSMLPLSKNSADSQQFVGESSAQASDAIPAQHPQFMRKMSLGLQHSEAATQGAHIQIHASPRGLSAGKLSSSSSNNPLQNSPRYGMPVASPKTPLTNVWTTVRDGAPVVMTNSGTQTDLRIGADFAGAVYTAPKTAFTLANQTIMPPQHVKSEALEMTSTPNVRTGALPAPLPPRVRLQAPQEGKPPIAQVPHPEGGLGVVGKGSLHSNASPASSGAWELERALLLQQIEELKWRIKESAAVGIEDEKLMQVLRQHFGVPEKAAGTSHSRIQRLLKLFNEAKLSNSAHEQSFASSIPMVAALARWKESMGSVDSKSARRIALLCLQKVFQLHKRVQWFAKALKELACASSGTFTSKPFELMPLTDEEVHLACLESMKEKKDGPLREILPNISTLVAEDSRLLESLSHAMASGGNFIFDSTNWSDFQAKFKTHHKSPKELSHSIAALSVVLELGDAVKAHTSNAGTSTAELEAEQFHRNEIVTRACAAAKEKILQEAGSMIQLKKVRPVILARSADKEALLAHERMCIESLEVSLGVQDSYISFNSEMKVAVDEARLERDQAFKKISVETRSIGVATTSSAPSSRASPPLGPPPDLDGGRRGGAGKSKIFKAAAFKPSRLPASAKPATGPAVVEFDGLGMGPPSAAFGIPSTGHDRYINEEEAAQQLVKMAIKARVRKTMETVLKGQKWSEAERVLERFFSAVFSAESRIAARSFKLVSRGKDILDKAAGEFSRILSSNLDHGDIPDILLQAHAEREKADQFAFNNSVAISEAAIGKLPALESGRRGSTVQSMHEDIAMLKSGVEKHGNGGNNMNVPPSAAVQSSNKSRTDLPVDAQHGATGPAISGMSVQAVISNVESSEPAETKLDSARPVSIRLTIPPRIRD